jgi:hypothetical protein
LMLAPKSEKSLHSHKVSYVHLKWEASAVTAKTSDGWLIGFDAGEFGGGLWWFSKNGSTTRPISEENIHALVPRGDLVLVLTGLDHLGSNVGAIYAYRHDNDPSSTSLSLLADLGSSPGAASLTEGGDLVIATQGKVLMLKRNDKLETLYAFPAMGALYPNSIVENKEGLLFVGMRFYVLQLLPDASHKYSVKWFTTTACTKAHVKNYDCVCNARTITWHVFIGGPRLQPMPRPERLQPLTTAPTPRDNSVPPA